MEPPVTVAADATLGPLLGTDRAVLGDELLAVGLGADDAGPVACPDTEESPAAALSAWATADPLGRAAPTPG